ncbi:SGNH/GDSL hydrolase family protein [Bosea sp. NPDC003192]|uniref:SGNH/GDSL hydrolase family protein n=1 Tax=Bosea sp. NPDC003192 TaxID=3390551 RepID=UPI003D066910
MNDKIAHQAGLPGRVLAVPVRAWLLVPLLLLGVAIGWSGRGWGWGIAEDPRRAFDSVRQLRLKTVQAQLDQVQGRYIVLLGDSHAELLYLPSLCGVPVVNAGLSGATLSDVIELVEAITPPRRAEAVLISVGTNDIWVRRNPMSNVAESGFRAGLAALTQALTTWSERRVLTAIPPVARNEEALFPRLAAARYSGMLAESCEPERCVYLDLFGVAGHAREAHSTFSDGVHLRDYASFVRDREPELCAGLRLAAPR